MSSGNGTTVANSAPWSGAQPALTNLLSSAQGLYNSGAGSQYTPFSQVAPYSDITQQGLQATQQRAQNGSPVVQSAQNALTGIFQPQGQAPGNAALQGILGQGNPYLDQQFKAQSQPVIDAVNAQAGLAGRTGSGADQQLLTRNLGQLASNIYAPAFQQQQQNTLTAAQGLNNQFNTQNNQTIAGATAAPGLAASDYTDLQNLLNVGGQYDQKGQQYTDAATNQWNFNQQQPWNLLSKFGGAINGLGGLGGQTSTTQPGQSFIPALAGAGVSLLAAPGGGNSQSLFSQLLGY